MKKFWVIFKNGIKFFIMADSFAVSGDTLRYEFTRKQRAGICKVATGTPGVAHTLLPHGFTTGDAVVIEDNEDTTPDVNGAQDVTVLDDYSFEIDGVTVTVAGIRGSVYKAVVLDDLILKSEVASILADGTIDDSGNGQPLVG